MMLNQQFKATAMCGEFWFGDTIFAWNLKCGNHHLGVEIRNAMKYDIHFVLNVSAWFWRLPYPSLYLYSSIFVWRKKCLFVYSVSIALG